MTAMTYANEIRDLKDEMCKLSGELYDAIEAKEIADARIIQLSIALEDRRTQGRVETVLLMVAGGVMALCGYGVAEWAWGWL